MTRPWLGSFASVMMMLLACSDDVDEAGDGTGDSSSGDSGSNTNPTTDPSVTNPSTDPSADGSETTDNDTGPNDTGTTETGSTGGSSGSETTSADTSATDSTGDTGSSSSGEPPGADYPACMSDDECSEPYTLCWPPEKFGTPTFCTLECEDAGECPVPSSGEAVPVCEGPPGTNICVLDCTEGECPDGMECVDIFGDGNFMRCTYT